MRIALEKPLAWEHRLLFQSWLDEVDRRSDKIREYNAGLLLDSAEHVVRRNAADWLSTRLHELQGIVQSSNELLNIYAQKGVGKPGQAGDPQEIIWVSKMLGSVLDSVLLWARRIRCARMEAPFEKLGSVLSQFVDDLIAQFEAFPRDALSKIEAAFADPKAGGPKIIEMTMVFKLSNVEAFSAELAVARARAGL